MVVDNRPPGGERAYEKHSISVAAEGAMTSSLTGPIEGHVASLITAQLLFSEAENPKKEIAMYINSPGGLVRPASRSMTRCSTSAPRADALHGQAASAASLLLCAGPEGQRYSLPNSPHPGAQPSASYRGQAERDRAARQEIVKLKRRLNEIYAKHTGRRGGVKSAGSGHLHDAEEAKAFGSWTTFTPARPGGAMAGERVKRPRTGLFPGKAGFFWNRRQP
jgi:ATP-dependent Clp protease protease subunit